MNGIINEHGTKIYGALTAFFGALQGLITTGAFNNLMSTAGVGWLGIFSALATAVLGGMTMARGFNNSTKEKVASVIEAAINATPPKQGGFVRLGLLAAIAVIATGALSACKTTPPDVIQVACTPGTTYTVERCAKGIAETYEVFQKRAEEIVTNPGTPVDVSDGIRAAEKPASEVVVRMLGAGAFYAEVKQQLAAGQTTEEQVAIANASLEAWVKKALPLIDSLGRSLGR